MAILCSMPGKYGDILWSLLTCRAIAEAADEPVDLTVSGQFGNPDFGQLLQAQPYLRTVTADPDWLAETPGESTGWQPPQVPPGYDHVYHLGYRGWPDRGLPFFIAEQAREIYGLALPSLDRTRPWITAPRLRTDWFAEGRRRIALGFSDDWFELKYGIYGLLDMHDVDWDVESVANSPRWNTEAGTGAHNWREAASVIKQAEVFVGCNSALHVLAVAIGTPVIILEPSEARHNPIFWPLGTKGPQVYGVYGGDGKLTFDARHLCDVVESVLQRKAEAHA